MIDLVCLVCHDRLTFTTLVGWLFITTPTYTEYKSQDCCYMEGDNVLFGRSVRTY